MSYKHVLITGGTGFCGNWMQATCPPTPEIASAWFMNHDQYETREWDKLEWEAIIHLAPVSPARVLAYAQKHHARVLFASSGAVYDKQDEYADHKRDWELECFESDCEVVVARMFCFTGAHLPRKMWDGSTPSVLKFIHEGIAGGPVHYYDVGYIRSYMHGEDLGNWLWKILFDGSGVYDVGASTPVSMRNVACMVADICGCEAVQDEIPEQKPMIYLPDTERAISLGCKETIGLREGLERTIADERQSIHSK